MRLLATTSTYSKNRLSLRKRAALNERRNRYLSSLASSQNSVVRDLRNAQRRQIAEFRTRATIMSQHDRRVELQKKMAERALYERATRNDKQSTSVFWSLVILTLGFFWLAVFFVVAIIMLT